MRREGHGRDSAARREKQRGRAAALRRDYGSYPGCRRAPAVLTDADALLGPEPLVLLLMRRQSAEHVPPKRRSPPNGESAHWWRSQTRPQPPQRDEGRCVEGVCWDELIPHAWVCCLDPNRLPQFSPQKPSGSQRIGSEIPSGMFPLPERNEEKLQPLSSPLLPINMG